MFFRLPNNLRHLMEPLTNAQACLEEFYEKDLPPTEIRVRTAKTIKVSFRGEVFESGGNASISRRDGFYGLTLAWLVKFLL